MPSTVAITNDPLLFDKRLAPIEATLQQLDAAPLSQAAKKLRFRLFVRVLLFRLFAQIESLGLLVVDLRTAAAPRLLGLPRLGLSTLHDDAFARYPHAWFGSLTQAVLAEGTLTTLPELAAFGPLWCVDSAWWPLVRQLGWLPRAGFQGVRLQLGLSLNHLCPAAFLLSYDRAPTSTERASLLALVEAGVTYIAERGYVSVPLYRDLMERGAVNVLSGAGQKTQGLALVIAAEIAAFDSQGKSIVDPQQRVVWYLLTSLPVTTILEMERVTYFYSLRWRIERLSYTLKSGALEVEKLQFDDLATTLNALAFYAVVVWQMLAIVDLTRHAQDEEATQCFTAQEIKILEATSKKTLKTVKEVTLALAKLVGFAPSKRHPMAGIKMLAMALERFHYLKLGFNANSS